DLDQREAPVRHGTNPSDWRTGHRTSPSESPRDESARLMDWRTASHRPSYPLRAKSQGASPQEPNPKLQLSSCGCMQHVYPLGIPSPLDEDEPASSPAPIPKYTKKSSPLNTNTRLILVRPHARSPQSIHFR